MGELSKWLTIAAGKFFPPIAGRTAGSLPRGRQKARAFGTRSIGRSLWYYDVRVNAVVCRAGRSASDPMNNASAAKAT